MAKQTAETSIKLVLGHEGGFVNDPHDPGGATNMGITRRTLSAELGRPATVQEVKDMSQTTAVRIYRKRYWDVVHGDELPAGVDYAVMDYAVNSGPSKAVKDLQRLVGVQVDGVMGIQTVNATRNRAEVDEVSLIDAYCEKRYRFMRSLRTWKRYGRGWTRRVMGNKIGYQGGDIGVVDYAIRIARKDTEFGMPKAIGLLDGEVAGGKAHPADVALTKSSKGKAAITAGIGAVGERAIDAAQKIQMFGDVSPIIHWAVAGLMIFGIGWLAYETIIKPAAEERDEVPTW